MNIYSIFLNIKFKVGSSENPDVGDKIFPKINIYK